MRVLSRTEVIEIIEQYMNMRDGGGAESLLRVLELYGVVKPEELCELYIMHADGLRTEQKRGWKSE